MYRKLLSKKILAGFFLLNLLGWGHCYAQYAPSEKKWLKENVRPINSLTSTNDNSDLRFLEKELKGVRILSIGESSHGTKEFYQCKGRLVKYLHEKLGFEVLIMESGLGETFAAYANAKKYTDTALLKRTQFENFQNTDMLNLFGYIKDNAFTGHPLELVGLDCQMGTNYFPVFLNKLLTVFDPSFAKKAIANLGASASLHNIYKDSLAFIQTQKEYLNGLAELKAFIASHADKIRELYPKQPLIVNYITREIDNLNTYFDVKPSAFNEQLNRIFLRDKIMASNVFWYTDVLFPDKKIIIWAHNLHISKFNSVDGGKMMGEYVYEKFASKSYSLGLFSLKGDTYQFWDKSRVEFNNTSDSSLEKRISSYFNGAAGFLSLKNLDKNYPPTKWLFNQNRVYELEVGREHDIIPALRHDGIIIIRQSSMEELLKPGK